jgi:protein involved in polysaccharide export with SLBB domain
MYLDFEPKEDEKLPKIKELSSRRIILTRNGKDYNIDLDQYFIMGNLSQNPYLMQNDIVKFHYKDRYISIFGGIVNEGQIEYIDGDNLKTIIDLAGGFSSDSDTGYVEITRFINRNDIERFTINNYSRHNSTKIEEFDHIYVRKIQNYKSQELITVEGEIQYPGVYSISDGSNTVGNLIEKCGGVTFMGDKNSIIINNILIEQNPDSELRRILQIPVENRNNTEISYVKARNSITKGLIRSNNIEFTNSIYNFLLSPGDHIIIPKKIDYVEVIGAIKHPGRYPFLLNYNPDDYITLSGGLTKNSTRKKYIIKYSTGQKLPFNNKLKIERGDIIFISEKIDYNSWDRFKEWMAIISQISTTIIVIQNILSN